MHMDILNRFKPLMSQALHFAGTQAGLETPLEQVQSVLRGLADKERTLPYSEEASAALSSFSWKENGEYCRFAVYAWIDELLLNAPRPDAIGWMALSLQSFYFATSAAGTRFFDDLNARLACLLEGQPQEASLSLQPVAPAETGGLASAFERAAALDLPDEEVQVLRVYALCLVYGFSGRYFDKPEELRALRKAAGQFLAVSEEPLALSKECKPKPLATTLDFVEPLLYVLVPLLVCLVFGLYCADILANLPLDEVLT